MRRMGKKLGETETDGETFVGVALSVGEDVKS